jgi:hypothetical protein
MFFYVTITALIMLATPFINQVGVVPMDESKVTMKGRLGPGMMITVDLPGGQVCASFYFYVLDTLMR